MNMIFKKILKDLWATKSKLLLVLIAMSIGIFGLSTIVYTYSISKRDLRDNYLNTNPASAILKGDYPNELLHRIRELNYVASAEIRNLVALRARSNSHYNWMPIYIFSSPNFSKQSINTFTIESGNYPEENEILIERDGRRYLDGNQLFIRIDSAKDVVLKQSGSVHDPGLAPSHMDHILYGYVNSKTFKDHFKKGHSSRLLVRFSDNQYNLQYIQNKTNQLIDFINHQGGKTLHYTIPPPGEHPHQGQLESLLFLQSGLGGLAILLSILLLISVITSIMSGQVRQIGIMKSTGATQTQLLIMYLTGIGILSAFAIIMALPIGYKTALAYSHFIATELNFDVLNANIPLWINVLLITLGLLIPILATLSPINKACKISIKNALNYEEINLAESNIGRLNNRFVPLWIRIAYNNTLRNKSRTILSIFTLMLGLALFFIGLNISSSMERTFQNNMKRKKYDFSLNLSHTYPEYSIISCLEDISAIDQMEIWCRTSASFIQKDNISSDGFSIIGFDDATNMLKFKVLKGKIPGSWQNTIVVNTEFIDRYDHLNVGDSIRLQTGDQIHTWHIAGIVSDIGAPMAYTSLSALQNKTSKDYLASDVMVKVKPTQTSTDNTILKVENALEARNIFVDKSVNQSEFLIVLKDHIGVILSFFLAMAILVLIVGCIGLVSIMNINIMERTKEIGIMRATGARRWHIKRIIFVEMLLFGLVSWLLSWLAGIPLSQTISNFFGRLILGIELDFASNPYGIFITLIVMLVVLLFSGIFPIRNAIKTSVQNVLNT